MLRGLTRAGRLSAHATRGTAGSPDRTLPEADPAAAFFHDLRTPLTVIRARIQLLWRRPRKNCSPEQGRLVRELELIDNQVSLFCQRLAQAEREWG